MLLDARTYFARGVMVPSAMFECGEEKNKGMDALKAMNTCIVWYHKLLQTSQISITCVFVLLSANIMLLLGGTVLQNTRQVCRL